MGDGSSRSCRLCTISFANFLCSDDLALSQKLAEELRYERETIPEAEPDSLTAFKKRGAWEVCENASPAVPVKLMSQVENVEGSDEVTLTRKFGNERCASNQLCFSLFGLMLD